MERIRWPEGFKCPACSHCGEPWRLLSRPRVLECSRCGRQTSLTAGAVMQGSRQPLHVWFWAAYLVTTQTPGMSALQFQRQLGLGRYETAFQMLHKLRAAMVRPERDGIGGEWPVELDETWVGGPRKAKVGGAITKRWLWARSRSGRVRRLPGLTRTCLPGKRRPNTKVGTVEVLLLAAFVSKSRRDEAERSWSLSLSRPYLQGPLSVQMGGPATTTLPNWDIATTRWLYKATKRKPKLTCR